MRIAGQHPVRRRRAEPDEPGVRATPPRPGGTGRRCTAPTWPRAASSARARSSGSRRRVPARGRQAASRSPASTRAGGWASAACTRCSPASTTCSATSCARHYRDWSDERIYQTARLIVSALIAKIHTVEWTPAILGTEVIDIGLKTQLERPAGARLADPAGHLADRQPRQRRHPQDHAGPQRRAVLADRGLRHRLPDASAAARRLPVRRPPDRARPCGSRRFLDIQGTIGRRGAARLRPGEHAVLVRPVLPRRDHPAQLPSLAAEVRAQRRADRPVGGGPGAHPPPRRAPLQRLPGRAAQAADQALGRALRRPGVGAPDEGDLPQRRRGRHHGRACSPRRRRRASGSPTPPSASSS